MAELTFDIERVPSLDRAALVKVTGAIDTKTVVGFQDRLDELQKEGYLKFILDMEGIKYVNSTGLGALVNVADNLENAGGGMVLIKILPKVKVVFDMLGLNAFFKIYKNEAEALEFLKAASPAAAAAPAPAPAPAPPRAAPPPAPTQRAPAPAPAPAPAAHQTGRASQPAPPPPKPSTPLGAPIHFKAQPVPGEPGAFVVSCNQCSVNLTLRKAGSYKCPRCSSFFRLGADGTVQFFRRKSAPALKMTLACTDECTEGLSEFLAVLARKIGFNDGKIQDLKDAIADTCAQIIEKAYGSEPTLTYNVMISHSSTNIKIQFADYGKFIQTAANNIFTTAKRKMDTFEHKKHPKGGNVISMSKTA